MTAAPTSDLADSDKPLSQWRPAQFSACTARVLPKTLRTYTNTCLGCQSLVKEELWRREAEDMKGGMVGDKILQQIFPT